MEDSQTWYLLKHEDGTVFGPVSLYQLRTWADEAQISPLDKVSSDQKSWLKAPMLGELEMDYLIEVNSDQYYGPTTLGAVGEFLQAGEITGRNLITNCKDGTQIPLQELLNLQQESAPEKHEPVRTSIRQSLQQRIRELEKALLEERRARQEAETRCAKLEAIMAQVDEAL